nr:murein transglycosylase [Vibrio sinensis]
MRSLWICTALWSGIGVTNYAIAQDLKEQRQVYDKAQQLLDERKYAQASKLRTQLNGYPLAPYIDYRLFKHELGSKQPKQVSQFIDTYAELPFSSRISAPYISSLARQGNWGDILRFQQEEPRGEAYQCHYYNAYAQQGQSKIAYQGAEKLWLSGNSVSQACDPLFEQWSKAGLRTDTLVLDRMLLAFEARNGAILSYLSKQLQSKTAQTQAKEMKALFDSPEKVAKFASRHKANDFYQQQSVLALKKLARKSPEKAKNVLSTVVKAQKMSQAQRQELADYIAFRFINTDSDSLALWRDKQISTSQNIALIERRVRLSIQNADWNDIARWIEQLPEESKNSSRWQYWLARSEMAQGKAKQASKRLESILGQRNFYSVAAAKELERPVAYSTSGIKLDSSVINPYRQSLERIDELVARDKIAAAKSEWRWLLSRVNKNEQAMLAAYASSQRWHNLTVTATIKAKMWDNLSLRFPMAHRWWFNFYGEKHDIDPVTLMSLARQESAMDVEAMSPVGARGLMQIMPATAKYTAKKYQLSYQGTQQLYDVGKNIEIGSHYLKGLLKQYDNNRIFALAAYNAGPGRVKRWRARSEGKLDVYAFIEAIPFNETRGYVQNILMFETYYRQLLGVDGAFLTKNEMNMKY